MTVSCVNQYFLFIITPFLYYTVRPFIVNPLPKTTIAIEGKTKTIECTFKAKPSPTVTWYLDGLAVVSGSARFQVHTNITENPRNLTLVQSAFTINNAMLNDTGVLTCVAEHSVGNSSSSTNIVVHCEYIHLHITLTYAIYVKSYETNIKRYKILIFNLFYTLHNVFHQTF